jgi:mRNA interferase RelE/StbE
MIYRPVFTILSKLDYDSLDGSQKKQILKSLIKIENHGMKAGQALHGNLHDCRRLKHKKLGLRVIFKQSSIGIEIIEIVTIGKREEKEAYETAAERLGRI